MGKDAGTILCRHQSNEGSVRTGYAGLSFDLYAACKTVMRQKSHWNYSFHPVCMSNVSVRIPIWLTFGSIFTWERITGCSGIATDCCASHFNRFAL